MAGIKRHLEETNPAKSKKTKVQSSTEHHRSGKTNKSSQVKPAALPLLHDSSVADEGLEGTSHTVGPSGNKQQHEDLVPRKKVFKSASGHQAAKTSGSAGEGERSQKDVLSREAHAKQKALAQQRKAAKPNADLIARSKKIWERLRLKSHVPRDERKELVAELYGIITGRVKDFVFKHDAVRVVQTAIKYANLGQRRQIARELKGEYRALAESRYAKFLIAKLVSGDDSVRDMVVPDFYGHVKSLIRHPEAAWIMDDIYRAVATPEQKSRLLREWYGHEFAIFQAPADSTPTAELRQILLAHPEKRGHIMHHLKEITNQLVQKRTTGFTMLHDALLQYFLNCTRGSPEAAEVIEMLKDDEEGDCLKNLAFTKSGSRLVCLALAYGGSKDRRTILKVFKGVVKMLAGDSYGHCVLLTAFDVIDDTVMTSKAVFPELLSRDLADDHMQQELVSRAQDLTARIALLYPFSPGLPRWLLPGNDIAILEEVHEIRKTSSKKEPCTRRQELVKALSQPLLDLIKDWTEVLVSSGYGCQFVIEVLFGAVGEKTGALESLASMAKDKPELMGTPHAGRMLKSLVQGGPFDRTRGEVRLIEPQLRFESTLYSHCWSEVVGWASGPNSFVVVAMLESPHMEERESLVSELREQLPVLQKASKGSEKNKGNAGTQLLLQKIEVSP